jgi:hypothetical protein
LSEAPAEEGEVVVPNVTDCAWGGLKTVTFTVAGMASSKDGIVALSSWLLVSAKFAARDERD